MSGHSKWSTIKHQKGKADAERGKLFGKLSRELTIASRLGGPDPDTNARLRLAVDRAKSNSLPADNIKRAINKGSGEGGGDAYEEVVYEGYGPHGVAVLVEAATDNRNRTVADVRHYFSKHGGNLGESGSVAWQFERQGLLTVPCEGADEDALLEAALEAGASDVEASGENFEISTASDALSEIKKTLEDGGFNVTSAEVVMAPQNVITLDEESATGLFKLLDALEDHDDVQNVWSNFELEDGK
jgi:YebC/PmpR family DNA-binding regulatory protein